MVKQTFLNLPEEKRTAFINAARKEFARVPLNEASVANIIKEAAVSRGSFYQYFEDKESLYFYLLTELTKEKRLAFISYLTQHNGDIFKAIKEAFLVGLAEIGMRDKKCFYRNVFLNLTYKTEKAFLNALNENDFGRQYEVIESLINKEILNLEDDAEAYHIVQIVLTVMMQNIVTKFAQDLPDDVVINNFDTQMSLLKRGFSKK